ncbi:hypothetical protein JZ751_016705 [Albula glossodonta]|uniref:Uncharacterized protein n=1 Tax=Albula glossodonta TaxID=121402 RepID=A0A8T2NN20_9TELE|nr:hypothetical protein JZ751_016705 [Albula glossodonta]
MTSSSVWLYENSVSNPLEWERGYNEPAWFQLCSGKGYNEPAWFQLYSGKGGILSQPGSSSTVGKGWERGYNEPAWFQLYSGKGGIMSQPGSSSTVGKGWERGYNEPAWFQLYSGKGGIMSQPGSSSTVGKGWEREYNEPAWFQLYSGKGSILSQPGSSSTVGKGWEREYIEPAWFQLCSGKGYNEPAWFQLYRRVRTGRWRGCRMMDEGGTLVEFEVPEFSSGVLSELNQLRLQGKLCDIVVHIQGQPFRAHKAVLAASSPYFRDHSALGTMSGLSLSVIKSPEVFERLLAFCYTGRMSLRVRDAVSFLSAASFLQIQAVIDRCTRILEGLHSQISLPLGGSPGNNGLELHANANATPGFLHREAGGRGLLPPRGEGQSDGGSSDGEAELEEQVELIGRDGQVTDVRVKLERDEPSPGGGSWDTTDVVDTVDGEQVLAVSVGSYSPVPRPVPDSARPASSRGYHSGRGKPKGGVESRLQWGGAVGDRLLCVYCGKSFNQKGSLDRHMRLHMGITPFACIYCGKRYTRKDQLEYHIRGHTDNKPYRCHLCAKAFPFQGTLNQHLRKKHLATPEPDPDPDPDPEPDEPPPPPSDYGEESPSASP